MTPKGMPRSLLLLTFHVAIVVFSALRVHAELRLQQKAVIGFPVGDVLAVAQIVPAGDGAHRLAVLNGSYLLGLQWSPQRNTYDQTFFVQGNFGYGNMVLADVNGDSRNDIVVFAGYPSETVTAYDSATGSLLKTFHLQQRIQLVSNPVMGRDVDGVPGDEMIVMDDGISAYKAEVRLWHSDLRAQFIPTTRAATTHGEFFVATSTDLIVLDVHTGKELRRLALPAGSSPAAVGQSDLDANPEIACLLSSGGIQLIDGITGAVEWTRLYPSYGQRKITMFDVSGDGLDEVLVRWEFDTYKESVDLLNGRTGALISTSKTLEYGGRVVGITSGCEPPSVLVSEGGDSSFFDTLWLLDGMTLDAKSSYAFDEYGVTGFAIADFDGDGRKELAVAHDGKVSRLRLEPFTAGDSISVGEKWLLERGMAAMQLDGHSSSEYVVAQSCGAYLGCITAWNPPRVTPLWQGTMDDGEMPHSAVIADVDGDGKPDVLSANIAVHSGAKGTFVYAFRGSDGKQLWRSINLPGSIGRVRVADVRGTGTPEVLALSSTTGIVRLSLAKGTVGGFYEFTGGNAFATYRRPGDARDNVVVATDNRLFILDDGQVKAEVSSDVAGTSEIEIADVDGDGVPEILLAQHRQPDVYTYTVRLQIRSIDTLAPLWTSEEFPMLVNFSQQEQLAVADVDEDGAPEVVFLSSLAVRVFKVDRTLTAATPPRFESSAALHASVRNRSCCAAVYLHWDHALPGTAPPMEYRVYRAGIAGQPEVLLATTSRNEFIDLHPGDAGIHRYSVVVADASGHAAPGKLATEVKVALCYRTPGKR